MPLRPFNLPYNVGIDICRMPRIRQIIMKRRKGEATPSLVLFCRKLFNPLEESRFYERFNIIGPRWQFNTESKAATIVSHLAGRWAAKEAIIKAVKPKPTFHDITILGDSGSEPTAVVVEKHMRHLLHKPGGVYGRIDSEEQLEEAHGQVVKVSISHDGEYATAFCIAPARLGVGTTETRTLSFNQPVPDQPEDERESVDRKKELEDEFLKD